MNVKLLSATSICDVCVGGRWDHRKIQESCIKGVSWRRRARGSRALGATEPWSINEVLLGLVQQAKSFWEQYIQHYVCHLVFPQNILTTNILLYLIHSSFFTHILTLDNIYYIYKQADLWGSIKCHYCGCLWQLTVVLSIWDVIRRVTFEIAPRFVCFGICVN